MTPLAHLSGSTPFMPKQVSGWYRDNEGWFMWRHFPDVNPQEVPFSIKVAMKE